MDFDTERDKKALFDRISVELDDQRVIEAMLRVPREKFVPAEAAHLAYADMALAIGHDQTISQPYMVALMTSVLGVRRMDRVLDIGTGSGYQAAVLAELAREVVSTERILTLIRPAERRLQSLGYANITVKRAGRELGLPDEPRFNGIIVGAGAPKLPTELGATGNWRQASGSRRQSPRTTVNESRQNTRWILRGNARGMSFRSADW